MARKKKQRKRSKARLALPVVGGIVGAFAGPIMHLINKDPKRAVIRTVMNFSGMDPRDGSYKPERMIQGYLPIVVGAAISVVSGKLGIKRAVSRSNPFVTI